MPAFGPFALLLSLLLFVLLPILFGELMLASLAKLHLSPGAALTLLLAIVFGGAINIPVRRIARTHEVPVHPLGILGLADRFPNRQRVRRDTIVAVNVGGCLIPTGLAIYELVHLSPLGSALLVKAAVACAANVLICYWLARPVPGVGIAIPGILPGLVAAMLALLLAPEQAAPVAFVAGVIGPLIGADLLHLKEIVNAPVGIVSIGGAGTFDGIVLSGLIAAYLA